MRSLLFLSTEELLQTCSSAVDLGVTLKISLLRLLKPIEVFVKVVNV